MKRKIKKLIKLFILIFIVIGLYIFLYNRQIYIGNSNIIDFLTSNINYLDNNRFNKKNNKELLNIGSITTYEYQTIFYNKKHKNTEENIIKQEQTILKEETSYPITLIPKKPTVYIYNTHQTEKYATSNTEPHNLVPTVMTTSYMLKEQLEKYGIYSFVEENSVSDILKKNKWNYAYSYNVTRIFLENAKKENPSLKFFIDVHRDSVKKSITTTEIKGKSYARVMLLLGLENKNYEKNLKLMEKINSEINKKYPTLSRGIYKKQGPGVNGVYNQDFSSRCILIEVGGVNNTIDEVSNTIDAISDMLNTYIKEDYEQYT